MHETGKMNDKPDARSVAPDADCSRLSDTPESSAAWHDCIAWLNGRDEREDPHHVALANLAEKLERERNEARRQWSIHQDRLSEANVLIAEIMRGEVNPEDEAEKWLRAYAPHHLFPENKE